MGGRWASEGLLFAALLTNADFATGFDAPGDVRTRAETSVYFRRRVLRLVLPSRFALAATRRRYRRTMSLPEAPVIRRLLAWMAASIFSLSMSSASRRAVLPPCISFMQRKAMTRFDSSASIIKERNIRVCRSATSN